MNAKPRRRERTCYVMPDGKIRWQKTPGGVPKKVLAKDYTAWIDRVEINLGPVKAVANQILEQLLARRAMEKAGVTLPSVAAPAAPEPTVGELLAAYRAHLSLKGDTARHVRDTASRISAVFAPDLPASALSGATATDAILEKAKGESGPRLPPGESFTPAFVRELLGVSRTTINHAVARLGLAASGNGKARRYPRATVLALIDEATRGVSPETANHYARSLRAFGRFLERRGRLDKNPFRDLALSPTATDRRHDRRALSPEEVRRLLAAAGASVQIRCELAGADRRAAYLLAFSTGWRASAVGHVTPADFRLDDAPPVVVMSAGRNKSKKLKRQALGPEAVAFFREYIAGRPSRSRLWPGKWHKRAAHMMRGDLKDAGIPYSVPGPDGPLYADFHALRHSCLTALGRVPGVSMRTVQEVAGHSTPTLTSRYMHSSAEDQSAAVGGLPEVT